MTGHLVINCCGDCLWLMCMTGSICGLFCVSNVVEKKRRILDSTELFDSLKCGVHNMRNQVRP